MRIVGHIDSNLSKRAKPVYYLGVHLISLLPTAEYDFWVREMTVAGLDFRNPVGLETLNCFKKVCIMERNTNESSESNPNSKDVQSSTVKKTVRSTHKIQCQDEEDY